MIGEKMIEKKNEIIKKNSKQQTNKINIGYIIKWKHISEKKWHNLVDNKVYKTLKEAFEVLRELEEEENGPFVYRIFEVIE